MTYPSGLRRDEAATVAQQFGVALEQVHRDHLISSILVALQAHADELIFFGGTALARRRPRHQSAVRQHPADSSAYADPRLVRCLQDRRMVRTPCATRPI